MDENELKQWVEYAKSPLVASRGWAFVPEDRAGWLVPLVPLWGLLGVSVGRTVRGARRRRGRHARKR